MPSPADPSVTPASSPAPWQVEPPRPADRGLVGRLLEDVVAEDPSVAPEVAAGTVRAGAWLHRERPTWSGVVLDPTQPTRTVVGYADVLATSEGAPEPRHLLIHPAYRDRGVAAVLLTASTAAVAELAGAAPAAVPLDDLLPDPDEVTYEPARVSRPRWRSAALGAGAIAAAGVAAVLAVQVAAGPLGSVLPFLSPRDAGSSSSTPPPAPSSPTSAPSPQPVVAAGDPIPPQPGSTPSGGPGPSTPAPTPSGSPTPTTPPTPPPPSRSPGLASLLLDPVVGGLVGTVDGVTGDALSPVTGVLTDTTDATTDVLDDVLDGVLGLLPAPSATTGPASRR